MQKQNRYLSFPAEQGLEITTMSDFEKHKKDKRIIMYMYSTSPRKIDGWHCYCIKPDQSMYLLPLK